MSSLWPYKKDLARLRHAETQTTCRSCQSPLGSRQGLVISPFFCTIALFFLDIQEGEQQCRRLPDTARPPKPQHHPSTPYRRPNLDGRRKRNHIQEMSSRMDIDNNTHRAHEPRFHHTAQSLFSCFFLRLESE